jgi:hypothetical protein
MDPFIDEDALEEAVELALAAQGFEIEDGGLRKVRVFLVYADDDKQKQNGPVEFGIAMDFSRIVVKRSEP